MVLDIAELKQRNENRVDVVMVCFLKNSNLCLMNCFERLSVCGCAEWVHDIVNYTFQHVIFSYRVCGQNNKTYNTTYQISYFNKIMETIKSKKFFHLYVFFHVF